MKQPTPIHKGHVPFARFLMALSAGIAVSYIAPPDPLIYSLVSGLFAGSLFVFLCLVVYTRFRQQKYYKWMGFLVLLTWFCWGCRSTWATSPEIDPQHFSRHEARALVGSVAAEPVVRPHYIRFPFAINQAYEGDRMVVRTGTLMVTVALNKGERPPPVGYGDELVIPARYQDIPPPYNPGELDYRAYLSNQNSWHQGYFSAAEVRKIGAGKGNPILAYALTLRKTLVDKFERYIPDKDAFAVASTLILGDRADLSAELLQAFSNTGTIHVLSVSGMHVVIVFWLFSRLLGWMDRSRKLRVVKFTLLAMAVWGYAALTGFSPSVLRASVMISFVMAASTFHRRNRIYNSISASAFFLLLYDPKFIADIGFQLSYLAVLGMVFLAPLPALLGRTTHRWLKPIGDYVWMSIAAQAGAGPLATYYFHQFPVYFLVANLVIALPAAAMMYLGFALLIVPDGVLAACVGRMLEKLIVWVNVALHGIEQLPMATLRGIWMDGWDNLWSYLLIVSVTCAFVNRSKFWFYGLLTVVTVWVCMGSVEDYFIDRHPDEVIVFNVKRDVAIGMIHNGEAWVYSNLESLDDPTLRYSVVPGLEQRVQADRIHWVSPDRRYDGGPVYVHHPFIQFGRIRLMVCDGYEPDNRTEKLDVDVVLIRNNPRVPLAKLLQNIRCKQLVVDASNHRFTLERMAAEAQAEQLPLYVLKNNDAWIHTGGN